jgi:hypothetical protein
VSVRNVAWLIYNGYVPRIGDHTYQQGRLELPKTWTKGDFIQATRHWESLGFNLSGYNAHHDYCLLRGDNLEHDLPSWEATAQLVRLIKKPKTTQRILDLMFKITTEWFDMPRFPSRDGGPWDKGI